MACLVSLSLEKLLQKLEEILLKQMKFWLWGEVVCSVNWQVVYSKDPAFKISLFSFHPITTFDASASISACSHLKPI